MNYEIQISDKDLFGRVVIGFADAKTYQDYYGALEIFIPFLRSLSIYDLTTGFYINSAHKQIRISYFCDITNIGNLKDAIISLLRNTSIVFISEELPKENVYIAEAYGGREFELQFRRYLSMQSRIGIDLIEHDSSTIKKMAAKYRWQVFPVQGSKREYFEEYFRRYSASYNSLNESQKSQFWYDISLWPNPPQVDWAHMFINLILGFDAGAHRFANWPFKPLSIDEINAEISVTGLVIS